MSQRLTEAQIRDLTDNQLVDAIETWQFEPAVAFVPPENFTKGESMEEYFRLISEKYRRELFW